MRAVANERFGPFSLRIKVELKPGRCATGCRFVLGRVISLRADDVPGLLTSVDIAATTAGDIRDRA